MNGRRNKIKDWIFELLNRGKSKPTWPDFSVEPMEVAEYVFRRPNGTIVKQPHAIFTNIPPDVAFRNGWLAYEAYTTFADMEWSRRYPDHEISIKSKKLNHIPDEEVLAASRGEKGISFSLKDK